MMVADPAEEESAQRPSQEPHSERSEGFDHRCGQAFGGKKMATDRDGEVSVDREVVPLQDIANQTGCDQPSIRDRNCDRVIAARLERGAWIDFTNCHVVGSQRLNMLFTPSILATCVPGVVIAISRSNPTAFATAYVNGVCDYPAG